MEPVVQEGNENYVHHMTVYKCSKSTNESSHDMSAPCPNVDTRSCTMLEYVWAIGGEVSSFLFSVTF